MSIQTIITHPGGAHKDDFLACSLLVARHEVPILRRDPSDEELADPSVAVVDVGHLHEPCLLYTSPSPRDRTRSRMPSSA